MLEEPSTKDVGSHLRENAALLLTLLAPLVVIVFASTFASDTRVARITWKKRIYNSCVFSKAAPIFLDYHNLYE
jgi:hypothetical protein